jgi:hypothetical protein
MLAGDQGGACGWAHARVFEFPGHEVQIAGPQTFERLPGIGSLRAGNGDAG